MRTPALLVPVLLTGALLAAPPKERVDKPGSQDHPLFTRMPGFLIAQYKTAEFDRAEFWFLAESCG